MLHGELKQLASLQDVLESEPEVLLSLSMHGMLGVPGPVPYIPISTTLSQVSKARIVMNCSITAVSKDQSMSVAVVQHNIVYSSYRFSTNESKRDLVR
jgi:hypothetical protein